MARNPVHLGHTYECFQHCWPHAWESHCGLDPEWNKVDRQSAGGFYAFQWAASLSLSLQMMSVNSSLFELLGKFNVC